ncbi:MAG: glycoside hydrolase 5 family protein, partial [Thermoguttaceae bacterium]
MRQPRFLLAFAVRLAIAGLPFAAASAQDTAPQLEKATGSARDDYAPILRAATTEPLTVADPGPQADVLYNKSWIYVDSSAGGLPLESGDRWEVPVEYYLDPADHSGTTTLSIWGTGPWIDSPDGKYAKKRGHIGYPGLSGQVALKEPGRGRHLFTFTVPEGLELVKKYNRLLLIANFRDEAGKDWPWSVRAENQFVRRQGFYEICCDQPGHLFTYAQPVRLAIGLKNVKTPGENKTLRYRVHDTSGNKVDEGEIPFVAGADDQLVPVEPKVDGRGVFLVEFDVPGWEKRHTTFARIPDLEAITQGRPTPFGMTNHMDAPPEEAWAVARRLGLSTCRRFTNWYRHHPGPGVFKFDQLESELEAAARHGIGVWLCIYDPPAFVQPGKVAPISYRAFDFSEDHWRQFVAAATQRLRGKFVGWEWLNEITPGGCDDPVGTYLAMCRIGSETARSIDPGLKMILAGGLYPRSFRLDMLKAGVGPYVDVLPVHYQNGSGIAEARGDLNAAGLGRVAVWEDESARARNAWGVPPLEELQATDQAQWILRQWTDELAAGCEKIIYFGGRGDAAGSWDYLLDDLSPRPVAATLAVFASKMFDARPLGTFMLGKAGLLHLFESQGRAVLVAESYESSGETIRLHTGSDSVVVTDYQGNEQRLPCPGGQAELRLAGLPVFIEDAE